ELQRQLGSRVSQRHGVQDVVILEVVVTVGVAGLLATMDNMVDAVTAAKDMRAAMVVTAAGYRELAFRLPRLSRAEMNPD
ncbi:hypothetical protein PF010_g31984, partial [Phytophthora fragariae]